MSAQPEDKAPAQEQAGPQMKPEVSGEIKEATEKGAQALFYTASQLAFSEKTSQIIKRMVGRKKLAQATDYLLDQSIKVHNKQGIPTTVPMVIAAAPFIEQGVWLHPGPEAGQ